MPSDLQITNIRDQANANSAITIASDGQITVNQNNPTLTLGSNTIFPDGTVTNIIHRKYAFSSNGYFSNQSGGGSNQHRIMNRESQASAVVPSFTAKQGYTYKVEYHFNGYTDQNDNVNSSGRRTGHRLYYGTTSRSQNDATFDNVLVDFEYGRNMGGSYTSGTGTYYAGVLTGAWYQSGSDATTYVYFTGNATDNGKRVYVTFTATTPMHLFITEYKGNVSTTVS